MTIAELIARALKENSIRVLVFGPSPTSTSPEPLTQGLRKKRIEIRDALRDLGHQAEFPEDLIDPTQPPPFNNPVAQEKLLMADYDLVMVLIGPPGTNVELGMIASDQDLCRKSSLFLCRDHLGGLAHQACLFAEQFDAHFAQFTYPEDLVDCHLLTAAEEMIRKVQAGKTFFS